MDAFDILKFVHVAAAVTWVGGGLSLQIAGRRAVASGNRDRIANAGRDAEWIGTHLYLPAALLVVTTGVAMVLNRHIGFGHGWIVVGLVGFTFSLVLGVTFNGPEGARVGALIDGGAGVAELAPRIGRLLTMAAVEAAVLFFVIFNMVTKPW